MPIQFGRQRESLVIPVQERVFLRDVHRRSHESCMKNCISFAVALKGLFLCARGTKDGSSMDSSMSS
eukprot:354762-Chlamydomonas_euryale.AAC.8